MISSYSNHGKSHSDATLRVHIRGSEVPFGTDIQRFVSDHPIEVRRELVHSLAIRYVVVDLAVDEQDVAQLLLDLLRTEVVIIWETRGVCVRSE